MANTIVKTPIVYYGGKTSILNHIIELVPLHDVYTETFFGGGTLFFAKEPAKNETINDRLKVVVNFYRCLKLNYKPLKRLIEATLISRDIHNEALRLIQNFSKSQAQDLNQISVRDRIQLAWAFWVCTNFAFANKIGGGFKFSNDTSVSVPKTLAKRKLQFTEALADRLQHAYIENEDAIKILRSRNVIKAFHYIDPPYPNADQGHYAGYNWDEYEALLNFLATECKGKFMLSSYNSDMLEQYCNNNNWNVKEITHRISGRKDNNFAKNRDNKTEVIVTNYSTPCQTLKLFDL
ncbi:MAG: DNA adenine methylase [Cyclobacteriaceae bacterium]|jgi:DNA adenine methylase|nr:DNA adenine methylase [Cytophagales bacterium]MCZ8327053.1 DNA adenine methylase [Cyclobacteriaceae bacterium]